MGVSRSFAQWNGGLKTGHGTMHPAHAPAATYTFGTRFEGRVGSNPEELLGAALSGCFSMALAGSLEHAGLAPASVQTRAGVQVVRRTFGFEITDIALSTLVSAVGADPAEVQRMAEQTARTCPVGRALAAVPITVVATLSSPTAQPPAASNSPAP